MLVDITSAKKVYTITFVHFEGPDGPEEKAISLDFSKHRVYISKDKSGESVIFSDDRLLMEHLYGMCWLAHYDAHLFLNEGRGFSILHPVGSDGSGNCIVPDKALFMRVNNKRPDKYFEEI